MKFSDLFMWARCLSSVYYPHWLTSEGVFCRMPRMPHPGALGEGDGRHWEPIVCECDMKHTALPSVMHFDQLTFADILCLPIYSSAYNETNQYSKYWHNLAECCNGNRVFILNPLMKGSTAYTVEFRLFNQPSTRRQLLYVQHQWNYVDINVISTCRSLMWD